MNKYLDAAGIALSAIWASKLRSLMTVLGNIVAVTSIIAVVSLIQGLNASVRTRNPQSGGRRLVHRSAIRHRPQRRRVASRAIQSARDAQGRRRCQAVQPAGVLGHAPLNGACAHHLPGRVHRRRPGNGRDAGIRQFLELRRRAGPAHQPGRSRRRRARPSCSAPQTAERLFDRTSTRSTRRFKSGACISAWSASAPDGGRCWGRRRTSSPSSRSDNFNRCSGRAGS